MRKSTLNLKKNTRHVHQTRHADVSLGNHDSPMDVSDDSAKVSTFSKVDATAKQPSTDMCQPKSGPIFTFDNDGIEEITPSLFHHNLLNRKQKPLKVSNKSIASVLLTI